MFLEKVALNACIPKTAQQTEFGPNTLYKRKGPVQHTFNNGSSSASDYAFREQSLLNPPVTRKKCYIQGTNTIGVHRTMRGTAAQEACLEMKG